MSDLALDSLRRRMRAMHSLYDDALATMTLDYDEFKAYTRAVFDRTEAWLDTLDAAELERVVITRPFSPQIASTYSARVAGPQGITLLDAAECWMYQHGLRHMGEIELARGLVGLGGMTS